MAMSSSSPFTTLLPLNYSRQLPTKKTGKFFRLMCSASMQTEEKADAAENKSRDKWELGKLALVAVTAGVLIIGTPQEAMAAKSGGRVGGQAFRSSAPRSSGPRINNSSPTYGNDFGWGKPIGLRHGWGNMKHSVIVKIAKGKEEGDIELHVNLREEVMQALVEDDEFMGIVG